MTMLDEVSALSNPGSLLSPHARVVASYDLEVTGKPARGYRPLSVVSWIRNANAAPFTIDYRQQTHLHLINGMGVTLGDSIIGLSALDAIRRLHPSLSVTIYRPAHAPDYVKQLHALAAPCFGDVIDLPVPLDSIPATELAIDVGNHLFWPGFATLPMIDFFLFALGMAPHTVPARHKTNEWLTALTLPPPVGAWRAGGYTLLCSQASTPVRSIPATVRVSIVDEMWRTFGLPVLGFGALEHDHYTDIAALSPDTASFLSWIAHARHVVTSDTAAVHVAAGFGVPSTAYFTTIAPALRVRDYPHCEALALNVPELDGMHAIGRDADLRRVERAYHEWHAARGSWLANRDRAPGQPVLTQLELGQPEQVLPELTPIQLG
ncbi:ADP-heptose--LPS heptosyltransferase [Mycetohabitans sp. B8]|uniref:ADP-heptose--LPS heptosyltransferase n=1 Tax=Mycetohabitans sp. B8 TaxID=2841845 RepID=UPI001F293D99|nr:ADP-heptose--LPS heptosyltransferase [Mycetohabitans sp. B8]MCG1043357.1 ADP-heptose--LPS heptosyltransferase [Mycetohabitans sp. B8]